MFPKLLVLMSIAMLLTGFGYYLDYKKSKERNKR